MPIGWSFFSYYPAIHCESGFRVRKLGWSYFLGRKLGNKPCNMGSVFNLWALRYSYFFYSRKRKLLGFSFLAKNNFVFFFLAKVELGKKVMGLVFQHGIGHLNGL
jgi:hypothetical protein